MNIFFSFVQIKAMTNDANSVSNSHLTLVVRGRTLREPNYINNDPQFVVKHIRRIFSKLCIKLVDKVSNFT